MIFKRLDSFCSNRPDPSNRDHRARRSTARQDRYTADHRALRSMAHRDQNMQDRQDHCTQARRGQHNQVRLDPHNSRRCVAAGANPSAKLTFDLDYPMGPLSIRSYVSQTFKNA